MNIQNPPSDQTGRQQRRRGRRRLPERERKVRRLIQNRVSAMKCRRKKKEQFKSLSEEAAQLRKDKQFLQMKVDQLTKALADRDSNRDIQQTGLPDHEHDRNSAFSTYECKSSNNGQVSCFQPPQGHLTLPNVSSANQESSSMASMYSCPPPTPFSEPMMQQRYGDSTSYSNSVYLCSSPPILALPQPWNLEIGMNWHMQQPHSSVVPSPSGFAKYSHATSNIPKPHP